MFSFELTWIFMEWITISVKMFKLLKSTKVIMKKEKKNCDKVKISWTISRFSLFCFSFPNRIYNRVCTGKIGIVVKAVGALSALVTIYIIGYVTGYYVHRCWLSENEKEKSTEFIFFFLLTLYYWSLLVKTQATKKSLWCPFSN